MFRSLQSGLKYLKLKTGPILQFGCGWRRVFTDERLQILQHLCPSESLSSENIPAFSSFFKVWPGNRPQKISQQTFQEESSFDRVQKE